MPPVPPNSTVSGVENRVDAVNGTSPRGEADFQGQVALSLTYEPQGSSVRHEQVIDGLGMVTSGGVFLNEKDDHGKDLRRWLVQPREDGTFVAEQGLYWTGSARAVAWPSARSARSTGSAVPGLLAACQDARAEVDGGSAA